MMPGSHAPCLSPQSNTEQHCRAADAVHAGAQDSVDAFKDFKADDAGASGGGAGGGQEPLGDDAKDPEAEQPKQESAESQPAAAPKAQSSQSSGLQPSVEPAAHATAPSSCTVRTAQIYCAQTVFKHHGRA